MKSGAIVTGIRLDHPIEASEGELTGVGLEYGEAFRNRLGESKRCGDGREGSATSNRTDLSYQNLPAGCVIVTRPKLLRYQIFWYIIYLKRSTAVKLRILILLIIAAFILAIQIPPPSAIAGFTPTFTPLPPAPTPVPPTPTPEVPTPTPVPPTPTPEVPTPTPVLPTPTPEMPAPTPLPPPPTPVPALPVTGGEIARKEALFIILLIFLFFSALKLMEEEAR